MKNLFQNKLPQISPTHATLLAVIGGYLVWMSYKMLQNTKQGLSTMSMKTTIILMVIMDFFAVLVFIYAGYIFYLSWKQASDAHDENMKKESETAIDSENLSDDMEELEDEDEGEQHE